MERLIWESHTFVLSQQSTFYSSELIVANSTSLTVALILLGSALFAYIKLSHLISNDYYVLFLLFCVLSCELSRLFEKNRLIL